MMILQFQFDTTYMLLPLTEAQLLLLDLLGEALAQGLLLLLELEVVALPRPGLSRLAGLELLLAVVLVVELLRRRNEVEHVRTDEQRAQLAEITVLVVLDCRAVVLVDSHNEWKLNIPSATPQRYSRPLTTRPSGSWTSSVEPMIEYGMASVRMRAFSDATSSSASTGGV
jgi:hypothetical protein